jgi:hypothetical protein
MSEFPSDSALRSACGWPGMRGVVLHDHSLSVSFFAESRTLTLFATDHGKRLVRLPCNNEKDRRQAKLSGFDSLVIGISTAGSRSADHATPHVLRQIIAALEAISFLPGEELPQMQARLHLAQYVTMVLSWKPGEHSVRATRCRSEPPRSLPGECGSGRRGLIEQFEGIACRLDESVAQFPKALACAAYEIPLLIEQPLV